MARPGRNMERVEYKISFYNIYIFLIFVWQFSHPVGSEQTRFDIADGQISLSFWTILNVQLSPKPSESYLDVPLGSRSPSNRTAYWEEGNNRVK